MPSRSGHLDQNQSNDMILGELRGQVRELVHGVNNLSGKFDGLTREVIALGPLAADIQQLKQDVQDLKNAHNKESGGYSVIKVILNSPVILTLLMGAAFIVAAVKGWFK
jgi:hypothetical protein